MGIEEHEAHSNERINEQANFEDIDSLVLFERLYNEQIRKLVIDLIEESSRASAGEHTRKILHCKDGKPLPLIV